MTMRRAISCIPLICMILTTGSAWAEDNERQQERRREWFYLGAHLGGQYFDLDAINGGEVFDQAIGEATEEFNVANPAIPDLETRKELYRKIQEIMLEEAWAIGYRMRPAGFAAAPYVQGFDWRVDNGVILENVWLMPH